MRGRREHLRSLNRSDREDLRPKNHFASGGSLEGIVDRQNKASNEYSNFLQMSPDDADRYIQEHGVQFNPKVTKEITEKQATLAKKQADLEGTQGWANERESTAKRIAKEYGDVDPAYIEQMRKQGYQGLVAGKPEDTEYGKIVAAQQAEDAENSKWRGDYKSKGLSDEDALKAYHASLKQSRDKGLTTREARAGAKQKQLTDIKAAQYHDTMAAKKRDQRYNNQRISYEAQAAAQQAKGALGQRQEEFAKDKEGFEKDKKDILRRELVELAKNDMDTQNSTFQNTLEDEGYTKDANGNWTSPHENAWERLSEVPVLGDIVGVMNDISGGAIKSGTEAGQNFGQGNWREGLGGLVNAGTQMASFAANPGDALANYGIGKVMDKVLPGSQEEVPQEEVPTDYTQDYGDASVSPHVSQMMSPTAPSPSFIGKATQPYLARQESIPVTENYGYMSSEQRAREHKAYDQNHANQSATPGTSSAPALGTPAPQASPPPPVTGTTAPPGVTNQQQSNHPEQSLKGGGTVGHSFYKELHSMRLSSGGGTDKWIQKALPPESKERLHENLHIPSSQKIPMKRLMQAEHSNNPTIRKEAQLADRLRHFHHGCR